MTLAIGRNLRRWLQEETRSERLVPALTSGVLMGITEVMFALSLGSLIFSGELAPFLPYGIGMALVSATVMLIGLSAASSVPGVIGSTQDSAAVILAVIAAGLAGTLSAAGAQDKLTTVLVSIAVTTLLTGILFLALGLYKLGKLVRFIPYPVVGGFLGRDRLVAGARLVWRHDGLSAHPLEYPGAAATWAVDLVGAGCALGARLVLGRAVRSPLSGHARHSAGGHRGALPRVVGHRHIHLRRP